MQNRATPCWYSSKSFGASLCHFSNATASGIQCRPCSIEFNIGCVQKGTACQFIVVKCFAMQVSNFDYLMHLNRDAGRSLKDLTQYPVFPWVIVDYHSTTLDLTDPSTFRSVPRSFPLCRGQMQGNMPNNTFPGQPLPACALICACLMNAVVIPDCPTAALA